MLHVLLSLPRGYRRPLKHPLTRLASLALPCQGFLVYACLTQVTSEAFNIHASSVALALGVYCVATPPPSTHNFPPPLSSCLSANPPVPRALYR